MRVNYDALWKNIIEKLFPHFLAFFMPKLYADVDLSLGYVFLDKELQEIKLKGKRGKNITDKLVKVRLKNGEEKWLLIHLEVQGKHEEDFGNRMFRYFYRIYDKYDVSITALALLTYKTDKLYDFNYDVYGTIHNYRYNTACIGNYREEDLLNDNNPFALVCLAVQYDKLYRKDEDKKFSLKRNLIRMLRERNYGRDEIIELLEFIDDALYLTDTMRNKIFETEAMNILEEDEPMAYISGFRRRAMEEGELKGKLEGELKGKLEGELKGKLEGELIGELKGMLKGLMEGIQGMLEIKFGDVPGDIRNKIQAISDLGKLESLKEAIKRTDDFAQIQKML